VGTFGVLSHDGELAPLSDRPRDASKRPIVDVEVEAKTQFQQQPTFQHARRDAQVADRRTDRAQQYGVKAPELFECRVIEDESVAQITRRTQIKGRRHKFYATGRDHLERGIGDFGSNAVAAEHGHAMTAFSTHAPTLPLYSILLASGCGEQTHEEVEGAICRIESL